MPDCERGRSAWSRFCRRVRVSPEIRTCGRSLAGPLRGRLHRGGPGADGTACSSAKSMKGLLDDHNLQAPERLEHADHVAAAATRLSD
jgi:hypothetical protein